MPFRLPLSQAQPLYITHLPRAFEYDKSHLSFGNDIFERDIVCAMLWTVGYINVHIHCMKCIYAYYESIGPIHFYGDDDK